MTEKDDQFASERASLGGKGRMGKLSIEGRKELARSAAKARWKKAKAASIAAGGENGPYQPMIVEGNDTGNNNLPVARWPGVLKIGSSTEIPCYVLDDGRRVITRAAATAVLTDGKGGGNLEQYLVVEGLKGFVPPGFRDQMIDFEVREIAAAFNIRTRGISAETFVEICQAYVAAFEADALTTDRQRVIAIKAAMFLAACAKVGLIAMIDEATGYQYARASDALEMKLRLFLAEEMRKWEKTFPDQLWEQFGRLTNWQGALHSRPKYWGNLVMEFIYENLDPDVAEWLRQNAPKPQHGQNYHQWLSEQYGLKKLVEHIWKIIGIASTCDTIEQLRKQLQEIYGRNASFNYALKIVRRSEASGQRMLFDPRESAT